MRWWGPRLHDARLQDRLPCGREVPELHALTRRQGLLEHGRLSGNVEPERIVCTDSFADAGGNVVPASHYGMVGDFPMEMLVTVTFEDQRGKTKLTLRHAGMPARRELEEPARAGTSPSTSWPEYVAKA